MQVSQATIPIGLKLRPQWVLWRNEKRDGEPTKIPYSTDGPPAKSNDPATWAPFQTAHGIFLKGGFSGIGFVFSETDEFCGIDLDGCRDPKTGEWSDWARAIVKAFDTYAELSPSETGVKLFIKGKSPLPNGRKINLQVEGRGGKSPGIEVYDKLRYFAVTGRRLSGVQHNPQPRQELLDRYCREWFPQQTAVAAPAQSFDSADAITGRARAYVSKMPTAVSGQGGHNATFKVACVLIMGFGLSPSEALPIALEWNVGCQPAWSERELLHKLNDADKQPGERGYLRGVQPQRWHTVRLPEYRAPAQPPPSGTLKESAEDYLDSVQGGATTLMSLGLADVDYAIGGGVERSEFVVIAARPSHGKSAIGLQAAYGMASEGHSTLIISEEMSRFALGKRAVQFASDIPQESWAYRSEHVRTQIHEHFAGRAPIYVVESCGTCERALAAIRQHVEEKAVSCVIVDYGQLLGCKGNTRYEQVTNTSVALRQAANEHKIVLIVLAQLSRAVESREKFVPKLGDLKESGQLEQDADVILFLLWPHRLDPKLDPHKFVVFVGKNRNRPINSPVVDCHFEPSRQMLLAEKAYGSEEPERAATDDWGDNERALF